METTTLMIEGMSCMMCNRHVTHALNDLEGVVRVDVDVDAGTAVVTYDPSVVGLEALKAAVAEAGYEVVGQV